MTSIEVECPTCGAGIGELCLFRRRRIPGREHVARGAVAALLTAVYGPDQDPGGRVPAHRERRSVSWTRWGAAKRPAE